MVSWEVEGGGRGRRGRKGGRGRERVWTELDWSGRSAVKGGRWKRVGRDRRSGEQSRGKKRSRGRRGREKKRRQEEQEEGRACLPDCLMLTVQPGKGP
jgi:hypothetical protein